MCLHRCDRRKTRINKFYLTSGSAPLWVHADGYLSYTVKTPKVSWGENLFPDLPYSVPATHMRHTCAEPALSLRARHTHMVGRLSQLSLVDISALNLARFQEPLRLCPCAESATSMRCYRVTLCSLSHPLLPYSIVLVLLVLRMLCACYRGSVCYGVARCRASTLALTSLILIVLFCSYLFLIVSSLLI